MSLGQLLATANEALWIAGESIGRRNSELLRGEARGIITHRRAVYLGLLRLSRTLLPRLGTLDLPALARIASGTINDFGTPADRLAVELYAAAAADQPLAPVGAPASRAERHLRQAADAIGAAGDLLVSHTHTPGSPPRTPEGAAIRAGGGVPAALADIADLARQAAYLDRNLQTWLRRLLVPPGFDTRPVTTAIRRVGDGHLAAAADSLIAQHKLHLPLLRLLEPAPPITGSPVTVLSAGDAVAAVTAARNQLWQDRASMQVEHLQLAADLGVAVHLAGQRLGDDSPDTARAWRQFTFALGELRGVPATGDGLTARDQLTEALRWVRDLPGPGDGREAEHRADLVRLRAELPALAWAMHQALPVLLANNGVFMEASYLYRPPGKQLFYAQTRWTSARGTTMPELTRTLNALAPAHADTVLHGLAARAARLAAPGLPAPGRRFPGTTPSPRPDHRVAPGPEIDKAAGR